MTDLHGILERADRALTEVPLPPGGLERVRQRRDHRRRSQRLRVGLAATLIAVLAVGAVVRALGAMGNVPADTPVRPTPPPDTTSSLGTRSSLPPSLVNVDTGERSLLRKEFPSAVTYADFAVSPDGQNVAFVGEDRQIQVANIDGSDARVVTADPVGTAGPSWSPDGKKIAYVGDVGSRYRLAGNDEASLYILDLRTSAPSAALDTGQIWLPNFSPDGRTILYTKTFSRTPRDRLDLWTVPAAGGFPAPLLEGAAFGQYSPDGMTIVYRNISPQSDGHFMVEFPGVRLADADGTNTRPLGPSAGLMEVQDRTYTQRPVWSPDGTRIAFDNWGRVGVLEVGSEQLTTLGHGINPSWVDDETLLVEACVVYC